MTKDKAPPPPSQRLEMNQRTVLRAISECVPGAKRYDISDELTPGLTIQVGPKGGAWHYRYQRQGKSIRLHMGALAEWSYKQAKDIANAAAADRRMGVVVDDAWMEGQLVKHGKKEAVVVPVQSWDWVSARDLYLATVKANNKARTFTDYRNRLTNNPELQRFEGRQVAGITLDEATRAIADIHARGVESEAEHVAAIVSAFFTWLGKPGRRDKTGVEKGRMLELEAPPRTIAHRMAAKKLYTPPMFEVGRLMAIAQSGALPEQIGLAIQHTVYTIQRITFIVNAPTRAMEAAYTKGEGLWVMDPFNRKTALRRDDSTNHVVPLPAPAWKVVSRAMELAGEDATYVYPGMHPNNRGIMPDTMSESAVQHNMSYLPGITATPHDLRRAFSHHGQKKFRWGKDGSKLILDHNEGHESDDVTVRSYDHDGIGEKWDIMRVWCSYVEEATAEALDYDKRLLDVEWLETEIARTRAEVKARYDKSKKRRSSYKGVTLAKAA